MQRRPDREQSLRETQRGWILCRDLICRTGRARSGAAGSIQPMTSLQCATRLTRRRGRDLQADPNR